LLEDDLAMIFIDFGVLLSLYCKISYLLKSTEVIQIWEFDNLHMTQCAKIIVGLMANVDVFYPTFTNVFFLFSPRFFTFLTFFLIFISTFITSMLWFAALAPVVGASCFTNHLVKCPVLPLCSLSSKIPSLSSVNRILLNWYKSVVSALSSLLNGMLHYQYIVTALKIIIYNNIVCFWKCIHAKLNVI